MIFVEKISFDKIFELFRSKRHYKIILFGGEISKFIYSSIKFFENTLFIFEHPLYINGFIGNNQYILNCLDEDVNPYDILRFRNSNIDTIVYVISPPKPKIMPHILLKDYYKVSLRLSTEKVKLVVMISQILSLRLLSIFIGGGIYVVDKHLTIYPKFLYSILTFFDVVLHYDSNDFYIIRLH